MSQWVVKPLHRSSEWTAHPSQLEYGEQRAAERKAELGKLKLHIIHL